MKQKTVDAARGRWARILQELGVDQDRLTNRHGPCPLCGGKDRFRFDDKNGDGTWFCNACGSGTGFTLLMGLHGWDFAHAAGEVDKVLGNTDIAPVTQSARVDPVIRLRLIAGGLTPCDGINAVRLYLRRRGLVPAPEIKHHAGLTHYEGSTRCVYPAMVCLMETAGGKAQSYHVTYLTKSGEKAPVDSARKVMPPVAPLAGSAIRLNGIAEHIGIAEGVETALAVHRDFGIPCWAAANATLLERFDLPAGIAKVTIFGDNDANYTGQRAAYVLANRLSGKADVSVKIPKTVGTDFADSAGNTEATA